MNGERNEKDAENIDNDIVFGYLFRREDGQFSHLYIYQVKSSWAGYYEYNTFDENGIIGNHPYHNNLFMATGFSGHGIQKAPAVGRAIAELILNKRFVSIDLKRLSFRRFLTSEPMREVNVF